MSTDRSPNVETLCRIYADAFLTISWQEITDDLQTHMALRDAVRRGCGKMAESGVLAVSALTDEQAGEVCRDYYADDAATQLRAVLARIAREGA